MRRLLSPLLLLATAIALAVTGAALAADDPGTSVKVLSDPAVDASQTRLAALPDGTAVVGWREARGDDQVARLAHRSKDGAWVVDPAIAAPGDVEHMVVAVGGTVTAAAWERYDGTATTIQVAVRDAAGASTVSSPPFAADQAVDRIAPAIAVRSDGAVVVVWQRGSIAGTPLESAVRSPDGAWSQPATIGTPDLVSPAAIASAGGATMVAFVGRSGAREAVFVATLGADGRFSDPVRASLPGDVASPVIAIEPNGAPTVAWVRSDGESWIAQATRRTDAGSFPRAQSILTLSDASEAAAPRLRLVVTESGRAALGAQVNYGNRSASQITMRDASGTWTKSVAARLGSLLLSFDLSAGGKLVQGYQSVLEFEVPGGGQPVVKSIDTCTDPKVPSCVIPARPSLVALTGGRAIVTWFAQRDHVTVVVGIADDVPPPPPAAVSQPADDTTATDATDDPSADDTGAAFHVSRDGRVPLTIGCRASTSCLVAAQLDVLRVPGGAQRVASHRRLVSAGQDGLFTLRLSPGARAELARSGQVHARLWVHQRVGRATRLDRRDLLLVVGSRAAR